MRRMIAGAGLTLLMASLTVSVGVVLAPSASAACHIAKFTSATKNQTVNENVGTVTVTIELTGNAGSECKGSISYATDNGSARAPGDYTSKSGKLCFGAGDPNEKKSIVITINNDSTPEGAETFFVKLFPDTDASCSSPDPEAVDPAPGETATITIRASDATPTPTSAATPSPTPTLGPNVTLDTSTPSPTIDAEETGSPEPTETADASATPDGSEEPTSSPEEDEGEENGGSNTGAIVGGVLGGGILIGGGAYLFNRLRP